VSPVITFLQRVRIAKSALLAMQSARAILSVRPSVRPSLSGIVFRRMKIRLRGLQNLVGQSF